MSDFTDQQGTDIDLGEEEEVELSDAGASSIFSEESDRDEFVSWVQNEIASAKSEREEQMRLWRKWRRQREARPERTVKNYPWQKASNVVPAKCLMAS